MISHMIDEAIRFSIATVLPDKSAESIIRSIHKSWVQYFGPPRLIIADGDSGPDSEEVRKWLDRLPSQVKPKALVSTRPRSSATMS